MEGLRFPWRNGGLSIIDKLGVLRGIVVPSESYFPNAKEKRRVEVLEMKC